MSKKPKIEVIKKIEDKTILAGYMSPDYMKKIVCCNIYDKFWGSVEVSDPVVKKFLETGTNANKVDFIAVENSFFDPVILGKNIIKSKPIYFIFYVI